MKNVGSVALMIGVSSLTAGLALSGDVPLDGATLLEKKCTSCHTLERVTAQKRTAQQWGEIIARMKAHETENPTVTTWTVPGPLQDKTRYYWRVRTSGEQGTSPWSEGSTFATDTVGLATSEAVELSEYWVSGTARHYEVTDATKKSVGMVVETPEQALDYDTLLVISAVENGPTVTPGARDLGQVYEVGPQGVTFLEPVTVKVPYRPADLTRAGVADASGLALFAYNAQALAWEKVEGVTRDVEKGLLVAQVDHFSLYAVGAPTAGAAGVAASGVKAPVADAGSDFTGTLATALKLNGTKSSDPNPTGVKQALKYAWTVVDHPEGAVVTLSKATTSTPSFTPPVPGDYTFCLVVSNKNGTSGERYVTVHVGGKIRVSAPVAGKSYVVGTDTVTVNWEATGLNPAKTLSLYLATDGGASNSWTLLKSGVKGTTKTYGWKATRATKYLSPNAVIRVCLPASTTNQLLCGQSESFSLL